MSNRVFRSYNDLKDAYFPGWRDREYLDSLSEQEHAEEMGRRLVRKVVDGLKQKIEIKPMGGEV